MVITVTCPACAASFPVDPNKIPEGGVKVRCSECANIFRVERPAPEVAAPEAPAAEVSQTDEAESLTATEPFGVDTDAASFGDESEGATDTAAGSDLASDETMPDWAAEVEEDAPRTDDGWWGGGAPEAETDVEGPAGWAGQDSGELETDLVPEPTGWVDEEPEPDVTPEPTGWVDEELEPDVTSEPTGWVDAEPEPASWVEPESPEEPAEPEQALPDPIPVQEPAPAPEPEAPVQGFTFGKRDPMDKARRLARVLVSDMVMYNSERHQQALAEGTLAEEFDEEIEKSWKEFVDQVGPEIADGEGRRFWSQALNDILAKGASVF